MAISGKHYAEDPKWDRTRQKRKTQKTNLKTRDMEKSTGNKIVLYFCNNEQGGDNWSRRWGQRAAGNTGNKEKGEGKNKLEMEQG